MGTTLEYLQGKGYWIRATVPDKFGKYSLALYPNAESLAKIKKLKENQVINGKEYEGVKNRLKRDDKGDFMLFSSPQEKLVRGSRRLLPAPLVFDKDNQAFIGPIGNGSDITIKLEVYTYIPPGSKVGGLACRLVSVRVDNLVDYDPKIVNEYEPRAIKGYEKVPIQEPLF